MSFSSRIFGMIEMELSRQLSFTLTLQETGRRLGVDPRGIRVGDTVRFKVTARNDADFKIRSIRGGISPTRFIDFEPLNFLIAELQPGSGVVVATIDAHVLGLPQRGQLVDQFASISLSAGADLSNFIFQEWEKPVTYVARPGQPPARGPGMVTAGSSRTRAGAIPLSGIPLSEIV